MPQQEMIDCREPSRQVERAVAIMHRLRAPGGCPWDAEQTHESLVSCLIEECYECIETIREGDWPHLREELGDVLLQVLFHAELAEEAGHFTLADVACELSDKMVRRHPHVFGESAVNTSEGVLTQWDAIKRTEQQIEDKPYLHNCGKGLPALMRAFKIGKKVAKVGFDWPEASGSLAKVAEEVEEVRECLELPQGDPHVEEELGDLLFAVVNHCRHRGVDPEVALAAAPAKVARRFAGGARVLRERGQKLRETPLDEMEDAWQAVKQSEKK